MDKNQQSTAQTDIDKVMLSMKQMQNELDEHRYHLERKIKQRTAHLLRQIALLESCNASLCDKFELAQKEVLALKAQLAQTLPQKDVEQKKSVVQIYGMNDQAQKLRGLNMPKKRVGHVAAS